MQKSSATNFCVNSLLGSHRGRVEAVNCKGYKLEDNEYKLEHYLLQVKANLRAVQFVAESQIQKAYSRDEIKASDAYLIFQFMSRDNS